jgi:hypothetical protein
MWRQNEGPFENILRLITYLIPFVPGLGWTAFILEKAASIALDMGLEDIGRYIDQALGLGPGSEVNPADETKVIDLITQMVKEKQASNTNDEMKKQAFLVWGLLRAIPGAVRILFTVFKAILLAVGASSVGEIYQQAKPVVEKTMEQAEKLTLPSSGVGELLDIEKDPSALLSMFGLGK